VTRQVERRNPERPRQALELVNPRASPDSNPVDEQDRFGARRAPSTQIRHSAGLGPDGTTDDLPVALPLDMRDVHIHRLTSRGYRRSLAPPSANHTSEHIMLPPHLAFTG
jgi:hypothetical protein